MNRYRAQSGTTGMSLLELTAGLAIAALVFTASFPALKIDTALKHRTEKAVAAELDVSFIEDLLTSAVHQATRFCFFQGVFLIGPENNFNDFNNPPLSGSGVGFIIPVSTLGFHYSGGEQGSANGGTICAHRSWNTAIEPVPLAKVENWLAVSADGITIAAGKLGRPTPGRRDCSGESEYRSTFSPNDQLLDLAMPQHNRSEDRLILRHAKAYLGIREAFIIAVDGNGVLRRISLTTRENAPIAAEIKAIGAGFETDRRLNLDIKPRNGRPRRLSIVLPQQCRSYEVLG